MNLVAERKRIHPPLPAIQVRSADFQICRAADFQIGTRSAGWDTCGTADLEICATTRTKRPKRALAIAHKGVHPVAEEVNTTFRK
jgi:hypothetical protein